MIGMVVGERHISDVGRDVADRGELREQRAIDGESIQLLGETPSLKAVSEISPVSQIIVPRGWTIRKRGVIILTVTISPACLRHSQQKRSCCKNSPAHHCGNPRYEYARD